MVVEEEEVVVEEGVEVFLPQGKALSKPSKDRRRHLMTKILLHM